MNRESDRLVALGNEMESIGAVKRLVPRGSSGLR